MKIYLATTGTVFGLITLAHLWRIFVEPRMATEPWFVLLTLATAALSIWAWRLARSPSRSHS